MDSTTFRSPVQSTSPRIAEKASSPKHQKRVKELVCKVGSKPINDVKGEGWRHFRPWQDKAYPQLVKALVDEKRFAMLIAPPGSGKSTVQKAVGQRLLEEGYKVIITVPETLISSSFREEHDGTKLVRYLDRKKKKVLDWRISNANLLFDDTKSDTRMMTEGRVAQIGKFLRRPCSPDLAQNVMVCTHASVVAAFKGLDRKLWKGTAVLIDEAHHARYLEEDAPEVLTAKEQEVWKERTRNRLGDLVSHYIERQPGPLFMTTATWLRGDADTIVPLKHLDTSDPSKTPLFFSYELYVDEYLETIKHLKEISFQFSVGDFVDVVREEAKSDQTTIIYLPPATAATASQKLDLRDELLQAMGSHKKDPGGLFRVHKRTGIKSIDFVDEAGRDERKKLWAENKDETYTFLVQNLMKEGADQPNAARSIVLGARSSLPMLIQMVGRLLRPYPGKKRVEFRIVIPKTAELTDDSFSKFTGAIFLVMALGWQFTQGLKVPRVARSQGVMEDLIDAIPGLTDGDPGGVSDQERVEEAIRGIIENRTGMKLASFQAKDAAKSILSAFGTSLLMALDATKKYVDEKCVRDIKRNPFREAHRVYEATFGKENYAEWRASRQNLPELTPNRVDQLIFLARCKYFADLGQGVDPMTIRGADRIFGGRAKMAEAIRLQAPVSNPRGCDDYAIKWPEAWGNEGWPTGATGDLIGDGRTWGCLELSYNLVERKVKLGYTRRATSRVYHGLVQKVQAYYQEHKARPNNKTKGFEGDSQWLGRRNLTLKGVCDEAGLPEERRRSIELIKAKIWLHFESTGRRPSAETEGFESDDAWLRKYKGSEVGYEGTLTLSKMCDTLGMPHTVNRTRSFEQLRQKVASYYKRAGSRPVPDTEGFKGDDYWLRRRNSSLRKLCIDMGIPGGRVVNNFSFKVIVAEITKFTSDHDKCPSQHTSKYWQSVNAWLYRRYGFYLPALCSDLVKKGKIEVRLRRTDRTVEGCKNWVKEEYAKTGKLPTSHGSKEGAAWSAFLRRQGSSLSAVCAMTVK